MPRQSRVHEGGETHQVKRVLVVEIIAFFAACYCAVKWLTKKSFDCEKLRTAVKESTFSSRRARSTLYSWIYRCQFWTGSEPPWKSGRLNVHGRHSGRALSCLTGMSSLEDKRKAFEAGMDGYLVKPVAFKTLDDMFHNLGLS
ncbi:hypothetical protein EDD16DRAFT_1733695 [Pisolithus croceorrhizus]|nr:hypothetical protein EDD16DRAFT_1733695 [Pisolithus croceorrhizus]